MLTIHIDRAGQKFLDQPGYAYEVTDESGALVCEGWSSGDAFTAREGAKEHARAALRRRERARLAAITGDVE